MDIRGHAVEARNRCGGAVDADILGRKPHPPRRRCPQHERVLDHKVVGSFGLVVFHVDDPAIPALLPAQHVIPMLTCLERLDGHQHLGRRNRRVDHVSVFTGRIGVVPEVISDDLALAPNYHAA